MSKKTHKKELARARAKRQVALDAKRQRVRVIAIAVILAMGASLFAVALFAGPGRGSQDDTPELFAENDGDPGEASYQNPLPAQAEACPAPSDGDAPEPSAEPRASAPEMTIDASVAYVAVVATTCGDITLALDPGVAPSTVNNFVALARDGYYDGAPFHRVINGFMVQTGDPTGTGAGCLDAACDERLPGYTFEDELAGAEAVVAENGGYPRGTLAMGNTGQPDTNGSQFFIVQGEPGYPLPASYTVFGSVTDGMDIVDRIAQGPVEGDLAIDPVRIVSVAVSEG